MKALLSIFLSVIILACHTPKLLENDDKEGCNSYYDTIVKKKVYKFVDSFPYYEGGNSAVLNYFNKHFTYSDTTVYQATFNLVFVIEIDGAVIGARIRNKPFEKLTVSEKEVIKIFESMPKWIPGKCKGKIVPVICYFTIRL